MYPFRQKLKACWGCSDDWKNEWILISAEAHRWRSPNLVTMAWIHGLNLPCVNSPELWQWLNCVRFSWLSLSSLLWINHCLNFTASLNIAAYHVPLWHHPFMTPIYISFSIIMHHIKAKVISDGFVSMTVSSVLVTGSESNRTALGCADETSQVTVWWKHVYMDHNLIGMFLVVPMYPVQV